MLLGNKIRNIGDDLKGLENLEVLYLNGNQLTRIPVRLSASPFAADFKYFFRTCFCAFTTMSDSSLGLHWGSQGTQETRLCQ